MRELPSKICKIEKDCKKVLILQELLQLDQAQPSEALAEKEASLLADLASVVQVKHLAPVPLELFAAMEDTCTGGAGKAFNSDFFHPQFAISI